MTFAEQIAARTLDGEARGEPVEGQKGIAHVMWNRVRDPHKRFGLNLAQVCLQKWQFSCWNQNDPNYKVITSLDDNDPVLIAMVNLIDAARLEADFTNGATHYYATSMSKAPIWVLGAKYCGQWGHTKFYAGII